MSYIDLKVCKRCGNNGYYECDAHMWWEEITFTCTYCGYEYLWELKADKDKGTEKEPYWIQKEEEKDPWGYFGFTFRDGRIGSGPIEDKPANEAEQIDCFKEIIAANPDIDPDKSYLTKWDDTKKELVFLVGSQRALAHLECKVDQNEAA